MKILVTMKNKINQENPRCTREQHENHLNCKTQCDQHENHENHWIQLEERKS